MQVLRQVAETLFEISVSFEEILLRSALSIIRTGD